MHSASGAPVLLPGDTTDDAFLGGSVRVLQPKRGYRAGLDAVLLAATVSTDGTTAIDVLDAGSGVGTVGLCIARRITSARVTLIEREPPLAALARQNIERNELANRVTVIEADLELGGAIAQGPGAHPALHPAQFDRLVANPPYRVEGSGTPPDGLKAKAHQHGAGALERWIAAMTTLARTDAVLTMIHEATALPHVLSGLDGRFGGLRILPIQPRAAAAATRIIVQARKGSRAPLELRPALVLHDAGNAFTPELEAVLRHGAPLPIA